MNRLDHFLYIFHSKNEGSALDDVELPLAELATEQNVFDASPAHIELVTPSLTAQTTEEIDEDPDQLNTKKGKPSSVHSTKHFKHFV